MKKYRVQQKTERRIGAGLRLALVAALLLAQIALVVGLSVLLQRRHSGGALFPLGSALRRNRHLFQ